jgi:hypothetical protein
LKKKRKTKKTEHFFIFDEDIHNPALDCSSAPILEEGLPLKELEEIN